MKTNFFKTVIAVFAILLAVSFAFAKESLPEAKTAYYFHPTLGWQSVVIGDDCKDQSGINCFIGPFQLYKDMSTSTPLRRLQ
jgi:hypothetical protein